MTYLSDETGTSNVWAVSLETGASHQLIETDKDISSFLWAPDARSLAFVMPDPAFVQPEVEDPDVFNLDHLWLARLSNDFTTEEPINLTEGAGFTVSTWAGTFAYDWAPDGGRLAFAHQVRPGLNSWTHAQLSTVDIASRAITPVETGNQNWAYRPKFSPDGQWIAFVNAPGEFKWSFLWDIKVVPVGGGAPLDIAQTGRRLPFITEWAGDSSSIYYVENDRVTMSFYSLPIDGSQPRKVFGSPEDLTVPGLNTYYFSPFVDVKNDSTALTYLGQTYASPHAVYTSPLDTFAPKKISSANDEIAAHPVPRTEIIRWRSVDGTEVEGLLTYPAGYTTDTVYPLITQIHGGPNGVDFNEYLPQMRYLPTATFATSGYFVLRANYRGSFGYGQQFREGLIGEFGVVDVEDILSGVDHVIDLGLVDPEQMFVFGQSNGATLVSRIITLTDRFQSACSIAGETDYISLEGTNEFIQTSWYLGGSFTDNLQVYLERSPIFHVHNVKTPVLIQGGMLDENVPFGQSEEFYRALKRVGAEVRLVGYPGSTHEYYRPKLYLELLHSCLNWINSDTSPSAPN